MAKKLGLVEVQKRCSRPLMNFANETPETRVFLDADALNEFYASTGEKLKNSEFDYKQAMGYVDRIEQSMVFNDIPSKKLKMPYIC